LISVIRLLNRQWVILVLAFISALLVGDKTAFIKPLVMPVVVAVMVLSASSFNPEDHFPFSKSVKDGVAGIICSYLISSGIVLAVSTLIISDRDMLTGFVMIAVSPPGVAIIPFTYLMGGRVVKSVVGTFGAFTASIILAPLIAMLFTEGASISPVKMAVLLLQVIILPFIIARILMKSQKFRNVLQYRGTLINWGMFLVTFTSVGLNSSTFFKNHEIIAGAVAVSIIAIFGTSLITEFILKKAHLSREERIPFLLMATIKNGGFGVVAALTLAGDRASAAAAIFSGFTAIYLVYISIRDKIREF
jgi:BASS family bile acid:Na+ symporter